MILVKIPRKVQGETQNSLPFASTSVLFVVIAFLQAEVKCIFCVVFVCELGPKNDVFWISVTAWFKEETVQGPRA